MLNFKQQKRIALTILALPLMGCVTPETVAINVGGAAFTGPGGTEFSADTPFVRGGTAARLDEILGTQIATLYRHYRSGDVEISVPLNKGLYDVTLHFAEPDVVANGERVFDVVLNGTTRIAALDIRHVRGAHPGKALTRTIPQVAVEDTRLTVSLRAQAGTPVLSGIVIRPHRPPDKSGYRMTWADEFDVPGAPDPRRWNVLTWDAGRVNDEAQAYTDALKNARVEDGVLIIEAHKERHKSANYTSARVTSKDKGDVLYGRVEVRARLPLGGGTWPAIWMYPTDQYRNSVNCETPAGHDWIAGCQAWPNAGEIDVMEHVGNSPGIVHGTVHTKAYYWVNGEHRKGSVQVPDSSSAFHEYATQWSPGRIDMFVDDTLFFTYLREPDADWKSWPFDHPFHLIMNLAIGGNWGGRDGGIDDAVFPQRLEIDYVRVYELIN